MPITPDPIAHVTNALRSRLVYNSPEWAQGVYYVYRNVGTSDTPVAGKSPVSLAFAFSSSDLLTSIPENSQQADRLPEFSRGDRLIVRTVSGGPDVPVTVAEVEQGFDSPILQLRVVEGVDKVVPVPFVFGTLSEGHFPIASYEFWNAAAGRGEAANYVKGGSEDITGRLGIARVTPGMLTGSPAISATDKLIIGIVTDFYGGEAIFAPVSYLRNRFPLVKMASSRPVSSAEPQGGQSPARNEDGGDDENAVSSRSGSGRTSSPDSSVNTEAYDADQENNTSAGVEVAPAGEAASESVTGTSPLSGADANGTVDPEQAGQDPLVGQSTSESPATQTQPPPGSLHVEAGALSDRYDSGPDTLNFEDYAGALVDFISHDKTKKPLTLCIDAPWGMGKTRLMRMIQTQVKLTPLEFPTVWFDAWKYDKQDGALWAALAIEIIEQTENQYFARQKLSEGVYNRLRFWVEINRHRFDWRKFWSDVFWVLIGIFVTFVVGSFVYDMALIANYPSHLINEEMNKRTIHLGGAGVIVAIFFIGRAASKQLAEVFPHKLSRYLSGPDYEEKVGFLSKFNEDFSGIVGSITENGKKPLIVFIDDLDRCAPAKAAEVVEAVNTLLDADHCVFVLGMDTETVAAAVDAKYKDVRANLEQDPGGMSMGEKFLEKIVQISFRIPLADDDALERFVDSVLANAPSDSPEREGAGQSPSGSGGTPPSAPPRAEEIAMEVHEAALQEEMRAGASVDEAEENLLRTAVSPEEKADIRQSAEVLKKRRFEEDKVVREAAHEATWYLGRNPRKIKRFVNAFRLQALIAQRRGLIDSGLIQIPLLAKALVITMRYPDFIAAIEARPDIADKLLKAESANRKYMALQMDNTDESATDAGHAKRELDARLGDPWVKRFFEASDLLRLLESLGPELHSSPEVFLRHLRLAGTAAPSASLSSQTQTAGVSTPSTNPL